jgi:hypothetical protein
MAYTWEPSGPAGGEEKLRPRHAAENRATVDSSFVKSNKRQEKKIIPPQLPNMHAVMRLVK